MKISLAIVSALFLWAFVAPRSAFADGHAERAPAPPVARDRYQPDHTRGNDARPDRTDRGGRDESGGRDHAVQVPRQSNGR